MLGIAAIRKALNRLTRVAAQMRGREADLREQRRHPLPPRNAGEDEAMDVQRLAHNVLHGQARIEAA